MNNHLLACKELFKTFSTGAGDVEVEVVRGVNLEVQAGDFTVLMGSSGSGKSTLLYLMSGLESITAGEAWFEGQKISSMKEKDLSLLRRSGMGFVFQAFNLIPNLTVLENILVAGYLGNPDKKAVEERARKLLENFGLAKLADRRPAKVSGGEQQRAATARSLINSPRILFADEPTGALNSAAGKKVLDYFTQLAAGGQTIFMVTHDLKAACRGNRVLYLNDGQIHGEYTFDDDKMSFSKREELLFAWLTKQGW
ncbi:MAG: ABC transporter ATP-binding protein [Deltaproteobacteria bacterium]|nr:ABC transporter ATP-binding protein [Deltaproteobacteria bacterium]